MSATATPDTFAAFIKKHKKQPATYGIVGAVADVLLDALKISNAKFAALETRCAALEQRPATDYKGVWSETQTYGRGALVTHAGSMWHAQSASVSRRPGSDSSIWLLAVKRGADGKDARA